MDWFPVATHPPPPFPHCVLLLLLHIMWQQEEVWSFKHTSWHLLWPEVWYSSYPMTAHHSLFNAGKSSESSITQLGAWKGQHHLQCIQRNIWVLLSTVFAVYEKYSWFLLEWTWSMLFYFHVHFLGLCCSTGSGSLDIVKELAKMDVHFLAELLCRCQE